MRLATAQVVEWLLPYLQAHPLFADNLKGPERAQAVQLANKLVADGVLVPMSVELTTGTPESGVHFSDSKSAVYTVRAEKSRLQWLASTHTI